MKIKQEIIEATYSIEELTKEEYELLKDGLREIIHSEYRGGRSCPSEKAEQASKIIEKML